MSDAGGALPEPPGHHDRRHERQRDRECLHTRIPPAAADRRCVGRSLWPC